MDKELIVLGAFFVLQLSFHNLHRLHDVFCSAFWQRVSHSPLWLVVFHPTVAHTIQDYSIHFVVYSGKVLGAH